MTRSLQDLDPTASEQFGGKAQGLGRLLASGSRVPRGFAVQATVEAPDLWPEVTRHRIEAEIATLLEAGPVAVRSSALVEDQPDRSFAGLFCTILDVNDQQAVFEAMARCIASGRSERVRSYARSARPQPVGVVVQSMVEARASGVLFTRDPMGVDNGMVLEVATGAGEALVSGHAEPERWRIYRTGLGTWDLRREPGPEESAQLLTEEEVRGLAEVGERLAKEWQMPLDLEWALPAVPMKRETSVRDDDASDAWWLQARPVTTLVEPPHWAIERSVEAVDDGPVTVWSNWNVRETMPEPLYPLSWDLWRESILPFLTEGFFGVPPSSPNFEEIAGLDRIQGRIYFNLNALMAAPTVGRLMGPVMSKVDHEAGAVVLDLIERGVLSPRRLSGSATARFLRFVGTTLRTLPKTLQVVRPLACRRRLEEAARNIRSRPPIVGLSDEALLCELMLWNSSDMGALRDGMQMLSGALLSWMLAERLFEPWPDAKELLAIGGEGNPTTEISARIDDLTVAARPLADVFSEDETSAELLAKLEETPDGRAWLRLFSDFLDFAGQRGPREFDFAVPRWADDPKMVLDLIRIGLVSPARESVRERLARLTEERRRAVDTAIGEASLWRRPLMRFFAHAVTLLMPLREAPKHYGMHVFYRMRLAAVELGKRLERAGCLENGDDVFLLTLDELRDFVRDPTTRGHDVPARLAARREELKDFAARPAPDTLRSDGVPVVVKRADGAAIGPNGELCGTGVSRGAVTGPVKVLLKPDPRLIEDGDVLVIPFADPGWTPLFPRASALVMEVGGTICHAAVVARELGIPAVFGIRNATSIFVDGQLIEVNGATGVVRPVSADDSPET